MRANVREPGAVVDERTAGDERLQGRRPAGCVNEHVGGRQQLGHPIA